MTDDETSNLFGLDDSSLGFIDDGSASGDIKTDPSNTSDDVQFDSSGWDFADTVPFSFDTLSSAPAVAPSYSTSVWDSPPFDLQQSPSLGFDDFSPSNNDATFMFGGPIVPSQTQNRPRAQVMKQPRQPTTTLTPAAQEKLRQIAMPAHLQYHSPKSASSPDSATEGTKGGSKSPSDKGKKPNSKKRKVSDEDEDDDDDDDDEDKPVKKTSHNMIEKRYRNNLNDKIAALRDSVPSLRIMSKSAKGEDTTEDRQELHGLTPAHKLNKATVLSKATEYIRHLEKRFNRLQEENDTMRQRIEAFEKLFMAGAMNGSIAPTQQPPTPMQFTGQSRQQQRQQQAQHDFLGSPTGSPTENTGAALGMIQVPDDMKRILAAQAASGQAYPLPSQSFRGSPPQIIQQQQLQQQQQEQTDGWGNAAPYFGKLMVGSLAGLMIMEAVRQEEVSNESPEGRGLFALPVHLLGRFATSLDFNVMGWHAHTSLKLLMLLGIVLWAFVPSLFASEDKPKKPQMSTLQPAPSLASSIHVRRQAWLTAVQSVWIPRQNLFLEASALILKAAKLSALNVIGPHGYKLLSGTTQDQEVARTRAWAIALDSQLVGGDVEINKSRLLITLLASGTLPDTPARLMLKALHIRVLTWDLSQHKWRLGASNAIAAGLARSKWNDARHLNQVLIASRGPSSPPHDDELPDHLAHLVEQSCDDVLNPELIQRAHNLAFNKATRYAINGPIDGMDCIVEDTAIGSPMDAVSAWFSTQILHDALTSTLDKSEGGPAARDEKMELAVHTAPVGSVAQARAIVARAALSEQHRGSNIALAFSTVGADKPDSPVTSQVGMVGASSSAASPDVRLTLRCAQIIAHLGRSEVRSGNLKDVGAIESIAIPQDPMAMSLLGFTAVMELMESVLENRAAAESFSSTIERLAGSLRLWIGGNAGDDCGLNSCVRHKVVDRCLTVTKSLVGMEVDTGYGSLSEEES